jgi:septum formation protein
LEPVVRPADVDETPQSGERPGDLVTRLARAKAEAVAAIVAKGGDDEPVQPALVVAGDTVIDLDGAVLGKPIDDDDAVDMLVSLAGRAHQVRTGLAVALVGPGDEAGIEVVEATTTVWMRSYGRREVDWYVSTGEPRGKAGAYAIQGRGSLLVDRIDGNYQAVVGLSLPLLDTLTCRFGWSLLDLVETAAVDDGAGVGR